MAPFSDSAVGTARASKRCNYNMLARLRLTIEKKRCPATIRRRDWMRWEVWAATLRTDWRITLPEQLMEDLKEKQLRKLKTWMRTLPFQAQRAGRKYDPQLDAICQNILRKEEVERAAQKADAQKGMAVTGRATPEASQPSTRQLRC